MKTRDFISGLVIMLFIGLMLTSCQKQEKRIIGEWIYKYDKGHKLYTISEEDLKVRDYPNGETNHSIDDLTTVYSVNYLTSDLIDTELGSSNYIIKGDYLYFYGIKLKKWGY